MVINNDKIYIKQLDDNTNRFTYERDLSVEYQAFSVDYLLNYKKLSDSINKEQLNTISLLQTKIIGFEIGLIQNHKMSEADKSQIALLSIQSVEKEKVINQLEKNVDELTIQSKKDENQISFQSEKIVSYLKRIEKLQDHIKILELNVCEETVCTNTSILNRIFKNKN
jgi:hypothetical protein